MLKDESKFYTLALVLVVLFGTYLRLSNLGESSFWADELDFVEAAKSQARVGEPLLPSGYAYPRAPLLTHALVFTFKFLGISEFSSRLPSAIFGILAIPLVFIIGRQWFDIRTGLIAAVFLACDPFEIGWSRACRMYALFQLSFMAALWFFWRGFESNRGEKATGAGKNAFAKLSQNWSLNLPVLAASAVFLLISYTSHQNAAMFFLSFLCYLLIMTLYLSLKAGKDSVLKSKYGILALVSLVALVSAVLVPAISEFFQYALGYQPKWAEAGSAQNEWRIFSFLFGGSRLPINLFFLIGSVWAFVRGHKAGVFSSVTLLVPVLLFSFVFQYRKNDYIYHVYPFFFLIAAFGLNWIVLLVENYVKKQVSAHGKFSHFLTPAILIAAIGWLIITPGFRFAQKIPRLPDGYFNGAIYHNEWKAASIFLTDKISDADALMSTLPLSVKYYLGRAEYNLNLSNGALALENNFVAADGRYIDFYSGADIIDDLGEFKEIIRQKPSGWLAVDNYRFDNPVYVLPEIRDFVIKHMPKAFESKQKTVSVYRWSHKEFTGEPLSALQTTLFSRRYN